MTLKTFCGIIQKKGKELIQAKLIFKLSLVIVLSFFNKCVLGAPSLNKEKTMTQPDFKYFKVSKNHPIIQFLFE